MFRSTVLLFLVSVLGPDARAALRINEVLYDPPGPDAGFEYVELFHSGAVPIPLDGFELWFLNGATPDGPPRVVWRAPSGAEIAPGGFRVIGGREVPERDETVELGLQNGPDALWLVRAGVRIDAVAWGDGAAALGEGDAAPQVTSAAIGRVPDGHDTDDNRRDFRVLPAPTPGQENLPAIAIEPLGFEVVPRWRASGGPITVQVRWLAEGWAQEQRASVTWLGTGADLVAAAGETLTTTATIVLDVGRSTLGAEGTARRIQHDLHIGTADLILTEVQARPESGEPEWVEVLNVSSAPLALANWSIADAQSQPRRIGGELVLGPRARAVLTAEVEAWRATHADAAVEAVRPEGGWPTLNDSDGENGYADAVVLFDPDSVVVDLMTYRARDIAVRGRPLQRTGAVSAGATVWIAALGGATPGTAHPAEAQGRAPSTLTLRPGTFTPDGDGIEDVLQIVAPRAQGVLRADVRDLAGVLVRELEGVLGDDLGYWQWDGRDARGREVPAGAYVIVVRGESDAGEVTTWRAVVGLDRPR